MQGFQRITATAGEGDPDMSYATNLWLFFSLLVGIILVPGMDMLLVFGNTLTGGRRAGLAATAGITVGGAVHTAWGAFGAGALALWLPEAFTALLVAGAAYMAWIGLGLVRSAITLGATDTTQPAQSLSRAFRQGVATCLLNPKAYVFVAAVYPQFVRPAYGPIWAQALVMGLLTVLTQATVYGGLALAAGRGRDALASRPAVTVAIGRAAGVLILVIAALTLWEGLAAPR
jgi:threonine/homoserine/homoserine lactone efflux protein